MFHKCGLKFREVEPKDFHALREQRNDQWEGYRNPMPVMTLHNQEAWYKTLSSENMAFIAEDDGKPIGMLRIGNLDHENRSADITGVDVFKGQSGKGYATKICRSAAEWLIHDIGYHRVKGECTRENIPMQKSLVKAGFTHEGNMRGYIWRNGDWRDFMQFSILDKELWPEDKPMPAQGL